MQHAYWCTWGTQNWVISYGSWEWTPEKLAFLGDQAGAGKARSMMNEESVFGEDGFLQLYPQIRRDLYFMLDDGWDVPYGAGDTISHKAFGSLELNETRFPSIHGTPEQRLWELNNRVKAAGWKGLGIWIAAQRAAEKYEKPFDDTDKDYWNTRILWSKYAGVSYWKVDWGTQAQNTEFRKFLTDAARKLYPELAIEHATCMIPINGTEEDAVNGRVCRFADDEKICALAENTAKFSQVFRTYDVLPALSVATTNDRDAKLLPHVDGYLNSEDEVYLGAALGCQLGIMRSKYGIGIESENSRLDEPVAAVKWQRYTPPFVGGKTLCSEEILTDEYTFQKNETWYGVLNEKTVRQGAPAVIARNTRLPEIHTKGEKPFVVASCHPNGNYAVCVLPRNVDNSSVYVGGDVHCSIDGQPERIAVFGNADSFAFQFENNAPIRKVMAQSLIDDTKLDITHEIELTENGFSVAGSVLLKLHHTGDLSAPGIMFIIKDQ